MDRQALQERFDIVGSSPALMRVLDRARLVAETDISVLLEGESGAGKEKIAEVIHGLSRRRHKRMVVVNSGAIPEGLIESELFGAEKGAYTGATSRRTGFFEEADGGTIFLDEVGEMPPQAQVRLLRVLESGAFSRVGSSDVLHTDVRIVAATNKDLGEEVRAGRFREDLYYRLSAVVIEMPPLRERREDILPLFETFLYRFAQQYGAGTPDLSSEARELLLRYRWPGNIRELRNVAEQSVVLSRGATLTVESLRPWLRGVSAGTGLVLAGRSTGSGKEENEMLLRALVEMRGEMQQMKTILRHLMSEHQGNEEDLPTLSEAVEVVTADSSSSGSGETLGTQTNDVYVTEAPGSPMLLGPGEEASPDEEPAERTEKSPRKEDAAAPSPSTLEDVLRDGMDLPTLEDTEHLLIEEALRRYDGNRRETAEALGISERTLYRKLKEFETG